MDADRKSGYGAARSDSTQQSSRRRPSRCGAPWVPKLVRWVDLGFAPARSGDSSVRRSTTRGTGAVFAFERDPHLGPIRVHPASIDLQVSSATAAIRKSRRLVAAFSTAAAAAFSHESVLVPTNSVN